MCLRLYDYILRMNCSRPGLRWHNDINIDVAKPLAWKGLQQLSSLSETKSNTNCCRSLLTHVRNRGGTIRIPSDISPVFLIVSLGYVLVVSAEHWCHSILKCTTKRISLEFDSQQHKCLHVYHSPQLSPKPTPPYRSSLHNWDPLSYPGSSRLHYP